MNSLLQIRKNTFNLLFKGRKLFHQFIVNKYLDVERMRLRYISNNQSKLRADLYSNVMEAMNTKKFNKNNSKNLGKPVILPSSFIGSPRHYNQLFNNAMAIVREFGKPDIFLTMTCNPN